MNEVRKYNFVFHRVTEITGFLPGAHWRDIKSADNPADLDACATTSAQLRESSLHWKCPD